MKDFNFYQWLPSIFIGIGIILWTYSLGFSTIANRHEKDLLEDWNNNLQEGILIMDTINSKLHLGVKKVVLNYPSDAIILEHFNEIIRLKEKAFQSLDKHLERSDTSTTDIIMNFQKEAKKILFHVTRISPVINDSESHKLISEQHIEEISELENTTQLINTQKQQILLTITTYLNFLAGKVGYSCGFDKKNIVLQYNSNVLKKGKKAKGGIFLTYKPLNSDTIITNAQYSVNGEAIITDDEVAIFKKTFTSEMPQVLQVECKSDKMYFENSKIVTVKDTITQNFIIYPTQ